jgi:uncharacterized Zn-binding protein involved in type VI secretion
MFVASRLLFYVKETKMPAVARVDQDIISTGHACDGTAGIFPPLQTTVIIENKYAAIRGNSIAPHTILAGTVCVPHSAVINAGSSTVFIGGIPVARLGDSADGGSVISGSGTVFVGG